MILTYECRLEVVTILAVLPTAEPKQAAQGDTADGPLRTHLHWQMRHQRANQLPQEREAASWHQCSLLKDGDNCWLSIRIKIQSCTSVFIMLSGQNPRWKVCFYRPTQKINQISTNNFDLPIDLNELLCLHDTLTLPLVCLLSDVCVWLDEAWQFVFCHNV